MVSASIKLQHKLILEVIGCRQKIFNGLNKVFVLGTNESLQKLSFTVLKKLRKKTLK